MSSRTFQVPVEGEAILVAEEHLPPDEPSATAPTVVLPHGWTLNRSSWLPVIAELHEHRNVRVVTYDQRGHGQSSMGTIEPTIRTLGHDLAAVIDATAPKGALVLGGHSMGGMTVMAYAGLHHKAFKRRVYGIVLVNTAASIAGRTPIPLEGLVMSVAARAPMLAPRQLVPLRVQGPMMFGPGANKAHIREAVRMIQRTKMPVIGKFFTAISQHDEVESLAHFVDVPTHILAGTHDRLIPVRYAHDLKEAIPHAQFTILPDKGHMLTYEASEVVSDALIHMIDLSVHQAA